MSFNFFLRKHQDWLLVALAALFLGIVIGFYIWGTNVLLTNMSQAVGSVPTASSTSEFLIQDAQKILSDRGLLQ